MEESRVLCAASAYEKKFYLNETYAGLPDEIKKELQIICVLFTSEVGGILSIGFDEEGAVYLQPEKSEDDIMYDEISCGLKIRQLELERRELWEQLEAYYKAFILN